jgi:monothiol glutaredoxin
MVNLVAVREKLEQSFKNAKVMVEDTHGDGHHFEAEVITDDFINKTPLERHQMVYAVLGNIVGGEMHALALNTKTHAETQGEGSQEAEKLYPKHVPSIELNSEILKRIDEAVNKYDVILFMKGTKAQPMCGFSATVCDILATLNVDFTGVNVLASEEIRDNIKLYSNWNTIPQLYIKGHFVGGCDITREMYASGELQKLLALKNIAFS